MYRRRFPSDNATILTVAPCGLTICVGVKSETNYIGCYKLDTGSFLEFLLIVDLFTGYFQHFFLETLKKQPIQGDVFSKRKQILMIN